MYTLDELRTRVPGFEEWRAESAPVIEEFLDYVANCTEMDSLLPPTPESESPDGPGGNLVPDLTEFEEDESE